jgi:hypothetical protein
MGRIAVRETKKMKAFVWILLVTGTVLSAMGGMGLIVYFRTSAEVVIYITASREVRRDPDVYKKELPFHFYVGRWLGWQEKYTEVPGKSHREVLNEQLKTIQFISLGVFVLGIGLFVTGVLLRKRSRRRTCSQEDDAGALCANFEDRD